MSNEQKKPWYAKLGAWLPNLSYIGVLITLFIIMIQVFYARRSMVETSEWEKAKMTIENIERFKNNLTKTKIYKAGILTLGDGDKPDYSTKEGQEYADTLYVVYQSLFSNQQEMLNDLIETLDIMNTFAYPIIMGYASEIGSFQSAIREYYWLSNFIMPYAYENIPIGHHAKLLYRLWRVRGEQFFIDRHGVEFLERNKYLLFSPGDEITEETLRQYEKKLNKELKKRQKEIEVFRKNSLK
ncbi:MAG: hypothetical protein LBI82_04030 [Dysgonamonadaceae bacterium]|jgi:hypothetical protein|nr:hypothetical protein [Dysgonamonadaceae bacterium]